METLKGQYFSLLKTVNPEYTERGVGMKLNSKRSVQLANEPAEAWAVRKHHRRIQGVIRSAKQKLNAFLREFQIFEIGVDELTLNLLKGPTCHERTKIITFLKSCCKDYNSRWCIESGFECIEYQFPFHYYGYSSDTHVRCYVAQAIVLQFLSCSTNLANWCYKTSELAFHGTLRKNSVVTGLAVKIGNLLLPRAIFSILLHEALSNYFCRI